MAAYTASKNDSCGAPKATISDAIISSASGDGFRHLGDGLGSLYRQYYVGLVWNPGSSTASLIGDVITSNYSTADQSYSCSTGLLVYPCDRNAQGTLVGSGQQFGNSGATGPLKAVVVENGATTTVSAGDNTRAVSINNDQNPLIIGYRQRGDDVDQLYWIRDGGGWKQKELSCYDKEQGSLIPVKGYPIQVNNRFEILTDAGIIRNGILEKIGYPNSYAGSAINNQGAILAGVNLLLPVEVIQIYKPETTSDSQWQSDSEKMPLGIPLLINSPDNQDLKFKVKFPTELPELSKIGLEVEVAIYPQGTTSNPSWVKVKPDGNDRLSVNKKEIWMTVTNQEIKDQIASPEPGENVLEFCSFDGPGSQNFEDSDAFDNGASAITAARRKGVRARDSGNWTKTVTNVGGATSLPLDSKS